MNETYDEWMIDNVTHKYGTCAEVTLAMEEEFSELTRVRGHYYCSSWGERAHWWLVDSDGEIIDPTAGQFPSNGRGHYEQWDDELPEPTGMCPNCGDSCYNGDSVCSHACGREYVAFLNEVI